MATKRLPMRKLREILRLKWLQGRSHRQTASSLGVSAGAVASAVNAIEISEALPARSTALTRRR